MNPVVQTLITSGAAQAVNLAGRAIMGHNKDENKTDIDSITKDTLSKIDNLRTQIDQANTSQDTTEDPIKNYTTSDPTIQNNASSNNSSDVSSACFPCARAHLIQIYGDLEEALRFARSEGIDSPEVVDRVDDAAKEVLSLERFDLSAEKIAALGDKDKQIVRQILPRIRALRQNLLNSVSSVDDLLNVTSESEKIYKDFREMSKVVS